MNEHRLAPEFRVDESGRTLTGRVLAYGDVADMGAFRETFAPRAFVELPLTINVNLQHDPDVIVARDAVLADHPRELRVRASLPEGSAAVQLVKRRSVDSFSIEFHALKERREAGIRVIERAVLSGLALVDRGAYPQSKGRSPASWWRRTRLARRPARELPRPHPEGKAARMPVFSRLVQVGTVQVWARSIRCMTMTTCGTCSR